MQHCSSSCLLVALPSPASCALELKIAGQRAAGNVNARASSPSGKAPTLLMHTTCDCRLCSWQVLFASHLDYSHAASDVID